MAAAGMDCSPLKASPPMSPCDQVPTPLRKRLSTDMVPEEAAASTDVLMCTRCGLIPRSTRKGVAAGLCCNKCPNHGPWCEGKRAEKCSGVKKCEGKCKAVKGSTKPDVSEKNMVLSLQRDDTFNGTGNDSKARDAITEAEVSDENIQVVQQSEATFNGTWYTSKDIMKEQPKTIVRGTLTWTSGHTTLLHFLDEDSVKMTFQGMDCKGTLKEDAIVWDDGDVWLRDETAAVTGQSAATRDVIDKAPAPRADKSKKGGGKGKQCQRSVEIAPMPKRRRLTFRGAAAAPADAGLRLAKLQSQAKIAEEKRQTREEVAAAKAALRQVNLETKARIAEERRLEKKALADVKASLRQISLDFKAKQVEQKDQQKHHMKEVNKEFQEKIKSTSASRTIAKTIKATGMPSEAEAEVSARPERDVENSLPSMNEVADPIVTEE